MTVVLVAAASVMAAMVVAGLVPIKPLAVQVVVLLALVALAVLGLDWGTDKYGYSTEGVVFVWVVFGPGLAVAVVRLLWVTFRRGSA